MDNKKEFIELMSELRGAPLSVLLLLVLKGSMTGNSELCELTGYSKNSVKSGLMKLESLGMVQKLRRYGGWISTGKTKQMLLTKYEPSLLNNSQRVEENIAELKIQGIGETEMTRAIAKREDINPEYIYHQAERLRNKNRFTTGLLIHILLNGDPLENKDEICKRKFMY